MSSLQPQGPRPVHSMAARASPGPNSGGQAPLILPLPSPLAAAPVVAGSPPSGDPRSFGRSTHGRGRRQSRTDIVALRNQIVDKAAAPRAIAEARERLDAAEIAVDTALGRMASLQPRTGPRPLPKALEDAVLVGGAPVPAGARGHPVGAHRRVAGGRWAAGAAAARDRAGGSTVEPPFWSTARLGSGAPAQAAVAGSSGKAFGGAVSAAAADVPSPAAAPRAGQDRSGVALGRTKDAEARR